MFCTKCGASLPETASFCTKCGSPVEVKAQQPAIGATPTIPATPAVPYSAPYPVPKKVKKRKGISLGLGIGIPALLLIVAFVIWVLPLLLVGHTSTVVNASGGTVKFGDLQMEFDAGSVQGPVDIKISTLNPSGDAKPDGLLSALYAVDSNSAVDKPITVRMKLSSSKDAGDIMLGIGVEGSDDNGGSLVHYQYVDTTVKDGYAEASITPSEYASLAEALPLPGVAYAAEAKDLRLYVGVFTCAAYFNEGGHFKLYYPGAVNKTGAEQLLTDLEDIFEYYQKLGYSYTERTTWPIEVNVTKMDDLGGYVESGLWNAAVGRSPNHGWIEVNKSMFLGSYQRDQLKPVLVHEFFHFVQANYVSGGSESNWFDEATATYYESIARSATPDIVNEHQMEIFDGVFPSQDSRSAGYARMPEIGFLVNKFGDSTIRQTYENIGKGMNVKEALAASSQDATLWAGSCYEYIVSGKAGDMVPYTAWSNLSKGDKEFSQIGASMELKYPSEDEIKQAQADSEPIVLSEGQLDIPALGARMLAVTVDDSLSMNLSEGMKLQFKSESGVDMRLFRIQGSNFSVINGKDNAIDVDTFKADVDGKVNYLLMLTNLSGLSTATAHISVELQAYPTLDELVGSFDDGNLKVTEVFISQKLRDEAKASADAAASSGSPVQGCDLNMINEFDKLKGQSFPTKFTIEKTGEDTGNLIIESQDAEPTEMPFTYTNGVLQIDYLIAGDADTSGQEATIKGSLNAAYGNKKDVKIDGTLHFSSPDYADDFYLEYGLSGSHALPAKP